MNESPSIPDLVELWQSAQLRTILARGGHGDERAEDYWAELKTGTQIAQRVTAGRWAVVAGLLRLGAADSWAEIGEALDMTGTEARDVFHEWLTLQDDRRMRTGGGMTIAEINELDALAQAVEW